MNCTRSLCSGQQPSLSPKLSNKVPCSDYPTLFSVIVNFFWHSIAFTYDNTSIISVYEDVSFQGEELSALYKEEEGEIITITYLPT